MGRLVAVDRRSWLFSAFGGLLAALGLRKAQPSTMSDPGTGIGIRYINQFWTEAPPMVWNRHQAGEILSFLGDHR